MYLKPLYNEKELQRRLADNDSIAFESLYRHYEEPLNLFLIRYVKVPELAEDLSQEIFSKIWENRGSMGEVNSFSAFLYTIARNHTLNFLNRVSKINAAKAIMIQRLSGPVFLADDKLVGDQYKIWLQKILDQMSPQMRKTFQLVRQEQKSYDEVAAILGISRNTVKKHMTRSVAIVKEKLANELDIQLSIFLILINAY
ncbi:MAG: sigma-70 family RNA polymerase sigma factor [Chitinophagaceae bacterium]|nr:sigma-70 family RNA polymerase sigma factor [Chitinophagaceae bacterium]